MSRSINFLFVLVMLFSHFALANNDGSGAIPSIVVKPSKVDADSTIFDVLSEKGEILNVTIELDMAPLLEDRFNEEEVEGIFSFEEGKKNIQSFNIDVSLRGKYRRKVCEFPPFMIKFSKKELKSMGLSKHNDIKLVTHCVDDKVAGRDNVAAEYLLYKMYQELTDQSLRVQLLKITYVDKFGNYPKIKRLGFIIEDTDEMAERLGGEECEDCINLPSERINDQSENLMSLFQFMIGNADFSTPLNRNVKLVDRGVGQNALVVPYDFDFSGMVKASYALPNGDFGLKTIEERAYLGYYATDEIFKENLNLFIEKEKTFEKIVKSSKLISFEAKTQMLTYMKSFYDFIQDEITDDSNVFDQMRAQGGDYSGPAAKLLKGRE